MNFKYVLITSQKIKETKKMGEFDMSVHHLEDKTKRNQESVGV